MLKIAKKQLFEEMIDLGDQKVEEHLGDPDTVPMFFSSIPVFNSFKI